MSRLNACSYCVAHHTPLLKRAGVSAPAVERVLEPEGAPELDRLVIEPDALSALRETP